LLVECDAARTVQVIVNLIGNAVKFSPKRGVVEVSVEAAQQVPQGVPKHWRMTLRDDRSYGLLTVADMGPGIPDSEKYEIFEKFHQVKQDKRTAGQGVGLGLAISQTIIEAQRGAIWVEDNPGGGSRFFLLLPAGKIRANESTRLSGVL